MSLSISSIQVVPLRSLSMPASRQLGLTSKLSTSAGGQETTLKYSVTLPRSTMSSTGLLNTPISKRACRSHGGGKSRILGVMGQIRYSPQSITPLKPLIHVDSVVSGIGSWCSILLAKSLCSYSVLSFFRFQRFVYC